MNIARLIEMIDPQIYENLKQAIELGRWHNGSTLTEEQKALCMQAVIAYDIKHKPEQERVGYVATPGGSFGALESADGSELRPIKLPGQ